VNGNRLHQNPLSSGSKLKSDDLKDIVGDEFLAAAAALHHHQIFPGSIQPTHYLYSQWLASRNTSALFGLQGKAMMILQSGMKNWQQVPKSFFYNQDMDFDVNMDRAKSVRNLLAYVK